MKRLRTSLVIAMMVMGTTFSFATEINSKVSLESAGAKQIQLHINDIPTAKVRLTNARGAVFHSETYTDQQSFTKSFGLTELRAGDYFVEIEDETSLLKFAFEVTKVGVILKPELNTDMLKPQVRVRNEKVKIFFDRQLEEAKVVIYDSARNVLKTELVHDARVRRYDFSKLKKGEYRIALSAYGKEFVHKVRIN